MIIDIKPGLFFQYIIERLGDVPVKVTIGMMIVFCAGLVILLAFLGIKNGIKWSARFLLLEYLILLVYLTLLIRPDYGIKMYKTRPFWSYPLIQTGNNDLLVLNFANIFAFIPLGLLLGCVFDWLKWWEVVLIGGCISFLIEIFQLLFRRGVAEFDDFFHNILGCIIGYGIYVAIVSIIKAILNKQARALNN